jgi:hypothetical protein
MYIFSSTKFQNRMKDANSKQNSNIQTFDNGFTFVISKAFTMVSPKEGRNLLLKFSVLCKVFV